MTDSVGVVVPAYEPAVPTLREYVAALDRVLAPEEVRIELDAADEAVAERLRETGAAVNAVPGRRGKGAAITEGFEALSTDRLAFADADGATPASSVADVVAALDDADLAAGSRRHPDAVVHSHQTFLRRRLGDAFAWLARRAVGVSLYDYQCGAKAVTTAGWQTVRDRLVEPGFAWDIDLLSVAAALDLRVVEVPVEWEDHPGSTVSPAEATVELLVALLAAHHRTERLRGSAVHELLAGLVDTPAPLVER
jgi:hypothetical protein